MRYLVFELGGNNTYVLRPKRRAIEWLANQLKRISWKNRFGFVTLKALSPFPRVLTLMPMVRSERITVAVENPFDVAVIRDRITLLEFRNRRAYKIAYADEARLRDEIERRKRLPESINTPPILEYDGEYPYLIEGYLEGRGLDGPVAEWDRMLEALSQLVAYYETDRRPIETAAAVRTIRDRLAEETDETVRAGLDLLETLKLPSTIYRAPVHGDLHAGNVFVNDAVYVLDWEDARHDFVIDDLFRPFVVRHHEEPSDRLFVQMVRNEGRGGRLLSDYARTIGPTAYGDSETYPGLAPFYLLSLLARSDANGSLRVPCRELLSHVVSAGEGV